MCVVWSMFGLHISPIQPQPNPTWTMAMGITLLQSADMCHRVQSLLTSPKSHTATATCLHLLFDIISRGRVWVRGDYDSFIHSTIRTLHWWYKYWAFRQDCQLELEHIWPRATWQHFFSAWTPSAFTIGDRWPPSPPALCTWAPIWHPYMTSLSSFTIYSLSSDIRKFGLAPRLHKMIIE